MNAIAFTGDQVAGEAGAFRAEVAEDVDGAADFAFGFGKGFAFLAAHLFAELVEFLFENVGDFEEQGATGRAGHVGPAGEGGLGGVGGAVDVVARAFDEEANDFIGIGGIAIFEGGSIDPFPIDVIAENFRHDFAVLVESGYG